MQVYVQSSVVEKGVTPDDYSKTKLDVWVGDDLRDPDRVLHRRLDRSDASQAGIQVTSAADAANALRPLAGRYAQTLFGVGLLGASMLAAGVLPLATAYSISEALGFEKGVSRSFREAPIFLGTFTFLIASARRSRSCRTCR
jgi:hypothetical protein